MTPLVATGARAGGTINFADIGVGDPDGDWSRYSKASGYNVNLVAIGNAPSAILNTLVAGTASYDVINIVGGMQKPLVDNNLIEVVECGLRRPFCGFVCHLRSNAASVRHWSGHANGRSMRRLRP